MRIGRVETVSGRKGKCHRPSATGGAQPPPGGHYSGREMPSFFIFFCKVERFIPRRTAVPFGPFLALGALVSVFAGQALVDLYVNHFLH